MESILTIIGWVLASVMAGVLIGYFLGRGGHMSRERQLAKMEKEVAFNALLSMLGSAEQLSKDVDSHNSQIQEVGRSVDGLRPSGEMANLQHGLLNQITTILNANKRLETDLVYSKYRLESQAQEMDRTRLEARTDALSGVANRKAFDETLQYLFAAYAKQADKFALVLCDVDHFKWINDTHGHLAGDAVVGHIGRCMKTTLRPGSFVARFGGDEFGVLLPNTDLEAAREAAEDVRWAITRRNFDIGRDKQRVAITFSIGVSVVHEGDTAETLLSRADAALYQSKQAGRNQVTCEMPSAAPDEPESVVADPAAGSGGMDGELQVSSMLTTFDPG